MNDHPKCLFEVAALDICKFHVKNLKEHKDNENIVIDNCFAEYWIQVKYDTQDNNGIHTKYMLFAVV